MLEDLHDYSDIFYEKRPEDARKKMSMYKRAAQFAPFAALTGFEEHLRESRRETQGKLLLDSSAKDLIDYKFQEILHRIEERPLLKLRYFVRDQLKTGGSYVDYIDRIKKIDQVYRKIIFDSGKIISMDDIYDIDFYDF
ncbi:MAG: hypothetical protein Q4E50_06440 [Tissierellia bacterium]|nr:hypothetical protein [Tissierellia bacterium]